MAATIADLRFRDVDNRFVIVEGAVSEELVEPGFAVSDVADAVLAYAYIDHEQGLSLLALAPASLETGEVFHDVSYPIVQGRLVLIRWGSLSPEARVAFPESTTAFEKHYAEVLDSYRSDHAPNKGVEVTRELKQVDALRSPEYPDDVLVILADEGLPPEGVWFRMVGLVEDNMPAGVLLNEPSSDYSVHAGDLMALGITEAEDGSPILFTMPDMLVAHPTN